MDLSEFDIDFLSQKLSDNPQSPLFARLADLYLSKNQDAEALKLCEDGVRHFPDYSSGHIILGKCYLSLNQNSKAADAFRKALQLNPFNQVAQRLLEQVPATGDESIGTPEAEFIPAGMQQESSEPQRTESEIVASGTEEHGAAHIHQVSVTEQQIPESVVATGEIHGTSESASETEPTVTDLPDNADEYIQMHLTEIFPSNTLDEYLSVAVASPVIETGSEIESIAAKLEKAGKIVPQEPAAEPAAEDPSNFDTQIVTPTLAEIYASQGQYNAAIQAYEILMLSRPDEVENFEKRIKELQQKIMESGGIP
jgi:tetratricopeptide (TPR) repeat protein